ncbi:MAG TPA: 30S ribosomal protein S20 [Thermodesulfobacteriota bacterium]
MANRKKSAIKRHRQDLKRRARNMNTRSKLRTLVRNISSAIDSKDLPKSREMLRVTISEFDKAASKGVIHKGTASRNISRFSKKVYDLSKSLPQSSPT